MYEDVVDEGVKGLNDAEVMGWGRRAAVIEEFEG